MLVLITLLAVGLLTLSGVALRGAEIDRARSTAQSNARLALQIAIGELQRSAGRDQVVTGTADVTVPMQDESSVLHPHLTCVWNSSGGELNFETPPTDTVGTTTDRPGRIPKYDANRPPRILVSGNTGYPREHQAGPVNATTPAAADWVTLVAATPPDGRPVAAPREPVPGGTFAYAVLDEGVKARIDLRDPDSEAPDRNALARYPGIRLPGRTDPLATPSDTDLDKTCTLHSLSLVDSVVPVADSVPSWFHDMTTDSVGLLTNSRDGGWRRDLTSALTRTDLDPWDETGDKRMLFEPIYYDQNNKNQTVEIGGSERFRPTFGLLREFFRYPLVHTGDFLELRPFTSFQTGIAPIPIRLQVALHPAYLDAGDSVRLLLHSSAGMVLWNPYNRPMEIPEGFSIVAQRRSASMFWQSHLFDVEAQVDGQDASWISLFNPDRGGTDDANAGTFFNFETSGRITIPPGRAIVLSTTPGIWKKVGNRYGADVHEIKPGWRPGQGSMLDSGIDIPKVNGLPPRVRIRVVQGNDHGSGDARMFWLLNDANYGLRHLLANFSENTDPPWVQPPVVNSLTPSAPVNATAADYPILLWSYAHKFGIEELPTARESTQLTGSVRYLADYNIRADETASISPGRVGGWFVRSADGFRQAGNIQGGVLPANRAEEFYDIPSFLKDGVEYGYVGNRLDDGLERLVLFDWPVRSMEASAYPNRGFSHISSIAQLADSGVTNGGSAQTMLWNRYDVPAGNQGPTWPIGNSLAPARLPASDVFNDIAVTQPFVTRHYDTSYLCNEGLYDRYFFSTLPQDQTLDPASPLANPRYRLRSGVDPETPDLHDMSRVASHLLVDGAFNVNSTSVKAWEVFLGSNFGLPQAGDGRTDGVPYSRRDRPDAEAVARDSLWNSSMGRPTDGSLAGYRRLTAGEIRSLATEMVRQVRLRGPFPSLSSFVNRLRSVDHSDHFLLVPRTFTGDEELEVLKSGALQAAIDRSRLNSAFEADAETTIEPSEYDPRLPFRGAMKGAVHHGVPGFITQGQILRKLDPLITVRSDTFRIRSYGEARSASGSLLASARCEVVVQRTRDFLVSKAGGGNSPTDEGEALTPLNSRFGRRFEIISFRWLASDAP